METTAELKLLLVCMRDAAAVTSGCTAIPAPNSLPCKGVNWEKLYQTASWHRLRPALRATLIRSKDSAIPGWLRERLNEDLQKISRRNALRAGELIRLLQLFSANGIPTLVLKGPALALKVYGEINAREFQDLDLLVRQQDYLRAEELLLQRFTREPTSASEDRHRAENYESSFTHEASDTRVDLHWRLHAERESYQIDYERYLGTQHRLNFFGQSIQDLTAEEWVLLLSIHAARHRFYRLHWLLDIAALLARTADLDWETTLREAGQARAQRCLLMTMLLLHDLWELPLPEALQTPVGLDPQITSVAASVAERLRRGECQAFQDSSDACFWAMNLQDCWSGRMRYGYWIGKRATHRLAGTLRITPRA